MNKTKIEWCDSTWNPVTGCLHGCEYCYARKIAERFGKKDDNSIFLKRIKLTKPLYYQDKKHVRRISPYPFGFSPTFHKYRLGEPQRKKKLQNIFVCSMADLFGDWVPQEWIDEVFTACFDADRHNYLFLTKNAEGYEKAIDYYASEERGSQDCNELFNNFWFGVTITNQDDVYKADKLQELPEGHRFLSIEPLHGPITLNINLDRCPECGSNEVYEDNPNTAAGLPKYYCDNCYEWESNDYKDLKPGIDWIIIGAETGNRKNKVIPKKQWIDDIVKQCKKYNVPVFMKDSLALVMIEGMLREFPKELKK